MSTLLQHFAPKPLETPQFSKHERISNFLSVPFQLEKFLCLGVLICFDSFLYNLTILPLRIVYGFFQLIFKRNRDYVNDILMGLLISIACAVALQLDASNLYHSIRSQSTLKLYVIFNVLEVLDKLFASFGLDLLDVSLSQSLPNQSQLKSFNLLILTVIYIIIHCLILLYQVITLNVAVNSYSNSVLSLLVSNQFMELKSSVFKKFERENLFQLSFSDSIERFQLFLFIFIISVRNLSQISGSEVIWTRVLYPLCIIYCAEVGIDALKHAFITKFNHIQSNVYQFFKESLASEFFQTSSSPDQSTLISRKMGFSSLPHTSLLLIVIIRLNHQKINFLTLSTTIFPFLLILKFLIGSFLNFWTRKIFENTKKSVEIEEKSD